MKKIIAAVLTLAMAASMSVTAFAATTWTPDPVHTYDTANGKEEIPMYGYVGPVVDDPTDPDPDKPVNPWTALNISVPVKFIWAAFDDGVLTGTAVESPEYNIINNSEKDVDVTVTDFTTVTPLGATDGSVTLNFTKTTAGTSGDDMAASTVLDAITAGSSASHEYLGKIDGTDTTLAATGETWTFKVGGTYTPDASGWPSALATPVYQVTFNFALA